MGRCQECGEWNSVAEEKQISKKASKRIVEREAPKPISELAAVHLERQPSNIGEWDRVLGGGLVPASVVLLGGEPGIGKSTLLLQAVSQYAASGLKILYVSGEESASQIALRSKRLGVKESSLFVASETSMEVIQSEIAKLNPDIVVIDSVQTMHSSELESQPGTVGQLRECAHEMSTLAKAKGFSLFLVGHVTKDGNIAGPKLLEHMVDVVLYFEGASNGAFRLLRGIKNRFGSTNEVGVFEMSAHGIQEVSNPSQFFLAERPQAVAGSVIAAAIEGTRPLLVEVQALVSRSSLSIPRRTSIGLDPNRVALLVAILEKRAGYKLYDQDVYINVAGGIRLTEPATDLAVTAAIISSITNKPLQKDGVFFGEVGLGGEVRTVPQSTARLQEAQRIGFTQAFVPAKIEEPPADKNFDITRLSHVGELSDFI